jgi:4-hydroxy-tetrahydrodipicolinate synthase
MLRQVLQGTGVALVTPFNSKLEIDYDALGRVIDFVLRGGVEYLITLGTTGETPTLTKEEKISLINYTVEKAAGKVPVVVGIGGNNTSELIKDLKSFPLKDATAVLSASPHYNRPSQEGIYAHYKAMADASPLPIILYNVPSRTGRNILASTVMRLAKDVPKIAGIKEASGDMGQCIQILKERPEDFLVVSGDDALALPQLACGMDGVISVAANGFPQKFSDLVRFCLKGDYKKAKTINDQLLEGYELLFSENNPAGVKAVLAEVGIIKNHLRLPLVPLSANMHQRLRAYLQK